MEIDAFWLRPDWSGGDNLRDPGTTPFWTRPPLPAEPRAPEGHVCDDFVELWSGGRFCTTCDRDKIAAATGGISLDRLQHR